MKLRIALIACLTVLLAFACENTQGQDLKQIDGLFYLPSGELYTGEYTTYFPSGERSALFHLKDGYLNNAVFFYRPDGSLEATGFFKKGKRDGLWQSFNEKGQKLSTVRFNNGNKVGEWEIRVPHTEERFLLYYSQNRLMDSRKAETFALGN